MIFLERFNILQINTKLSLVIHTLSKGEVFFSFSINKLLFFSLKIHTFGIRNDHYYEKGDALLKTQSWFDRKQKNIW